MNRQMSFAQSEYAGKKKVTRREKFLGEMERVVPWKRLVALLQPHYPTGRRGRPPEAAVSRQSKGDGTMAGPLELGDVVYGKGCELHISPQGLPLTFGGVVSSDPDKQAVAYDEVGLSRIQIERRQNAAQVLRRSQPGRSQHAGNQ